MMMSEENDLFDSWISVVINLTLHVLISPKNKFQSNSLNYLEDLIIIFVE